MPQPGVNITFGSTAPATGAPTATGTGFIAGLSEQGVPGVATKITSLTGFLSSFGARQSDSVLYDVAETFFREGGTTLYLSRVVGPTPVNATHSYLGAASAPSVTIKAKGPGTYGNLLLVAVVAGSGSNVKLVTSNAAGVLETSPEFANITDMVAWSAFSSYINITADGTVLPSVITATALASGTDDRANITNTQWINSLNAFNANLGPGQVAFPGQSITVLHSALLAHAAANVRTAILDTPNSATLGTLTTASLAARADANAQYGGMFGPWVTIPGIVPNTVRSVPYSAVQMGLIARSDRYFNQGRAVAGREFPLQYVVSFPDFTEAEHTTALLAGLNLSKNVYGTLETYGFRSLVDPNVDITWLQLNYQRLRMAIIARLNSIAEQFVFTQIDGAGHTILSYRDSLNAVLLDLYVQGALYGASAAEAFRIDVGSSVNTPTTIANGELHATIGLKMSPHAEMVYVTISKTPITQAV